MSRRRLRRDARLLDAGSLSLYVNRLTVLFCVTYVFCLFVVLVMLSVPVQVID